MSEIKALNFEVGRKYTSKDNISYIYLEYVEALGLYHFMKHNNNSYIRVALTADEVYGIEMKE